MTDPPAAAPPGPGPSGSGQVRTRTLLNDGDLNYARQDALLQLRIGQTAQYYSLILFLLLFADGLVVVAYQSALPSTLTTAGRTAGPIAFAALFAGLPLVGALLLSFFGLYVKWEEYQMWPWEPHFWITFLSAAGSAALAYLYAASLGGFGPTGSWTLFPWLYPLELLAISGALIGMALTWKVMSQRQMIALGSAAVPVALGIASVANPSPESLTLTLVASAGLYLASSSWLHLISSGTQAHQRELLSSNESRVFRLATDLRKREDALQLRENALIRREAEAESTDRALARQKDAYADVENQLKNYEQDVEQRATALRQELQRASAQLAEIAQREQTVDRQNSEISRRDAALKEWEAQRGDREAKVSAAENSMLERQLALTNREREAAAAPDVAAQAAAQLRAAQAREAAVQEREAKLAARESAAAPIAGAVAADATAAAWTAAMDEQSKALDRRSADLESRASELQRLSTESQKRERALAGRESQIQRRESDFAAQQQRLDSRGKELDARGTAFDTERAAQARRAADADARAEETRRKDALLTARETAFRQRQEEMLSTQAELTARERRIAEREKLLDARASEVTLERQRGEDSGTTLIGLPASLRDRESPESEEPVPWMTPPADAEPAPAPAPTEFAREPAPDAPGGRKIPRVPTGIARLDDVLQGGYPANGHVLLLGAPFLGREVAVNAFLADGLRRGERIVVATTARTPNELASEMGLLLPQFREYEQNGRVTWIDATHPNAAASEPTDPEHPMFVVQGPGDFAGILSALSTALKDPRADVSPTPVRVALTHLSACLAHGTDDEVFAFVNNLVAVLKNEPATTVSGIDPATVPPKRVEQLLNRVDGAIVFETDAGRTWLSAKGMGDLPYRQRIEYRSTSATLVLGSLALERIR